MTPARHQLLILAGPTSVQSLTLMPREFGLSHKFHFRDRERDERPNVSVDTHFTHGVVFAPLDKLEVGVALPVSLPGGVGQIPIWLTYRFVDGPLQLGFRHAIFIPVGGGKHGTFQFALPLLYRTGRIRVETALAFNVTTTRRATMHFFIPLRVGFQMAPRWYAGFETGLYTRARSGDDADASIPLYGFVGHTIPTRALPVDISLRLGFDRLLGTRRTPFDPVFSVRHFSIAAGVNFGFQLGR